MAKKFIVKSVENPDWNGTWLKNDVEQEMHDLGQDPCGNDWLYWVTDHLFECKDFDRITQTFICESDKILELTLRFNDGEVTICKI